MHPEIQAAYSVALRYLAMREYSEVELRNKLLGRALDAIAVDSAMELLKHYGYLSDARYAEAFLRARMKRGETPWLAAEKARQKGVDEAALSNALQATLDDEDGGYHPREACIALLHKRDPQGARHSDTRVWQRQARYLRNKGFDASTIVDVLNRKNEE